MDVDSLEAGDDFVERLNSALTSADVVLVVIGRQWLTITDDAGQRRLDNKQDFVRQEVGRSFVLNLPVIPILVQGATMPAESQLPEELAPLSRRQAIELRHPSWSDDVTRLAERIEFLSAEAKWGGPTVESLADGIVAKHHFPSATRHGLPGASPRFWNSEIPVRVVVALCLLIALGYAAYSSWKYLALAPQREILALADQVRYELPEETVTATLQTLRDDVVRRNNPQLTALAVTRLKAVVQSDSDTTNKGRHIRAAALELIKVLRHNDLTIDFKGDDLKAADLVGVDLSRVNMKGISMEDAFLLSTDFSGSDLTAANLSGAFIRNATFSGVTLTGANMDDLDWYNALGFTESILQGVDRSHLSACPANKAGAHTIADFEADYSNNYAFSLDDIGSDKAQLMKLWNEYGAHGGLCGIVDKWTANQ
jgi:hypothetical protein